MRDYAVSTRISMLRFLMIFGVLIVHTPPTWKVHELDGTFWTYFVSFLQNGIFRAGVPVLTLISGFLLFGANADLRYLSLLSRKVRSLFIPFMVFNLGHILLQIILRIATGKWLGDDLLNQGIDEWWNSLFGIWSPPENEPLHFLRELIVLIILSPLFGILLRKAPVVGFVAVALFFLTNSDGYLTNRSDMPVEFYVGGLAAIYKWNLKALDRFRYVSLLVFCLLCALVTILKLADVTWLRLIAPFLVWSASSCLVDTRIGRWLASLSMYSFFLYLTHAPLMRIIWIFFQKAFPSVPVPLFTSIAPFAVAVICIGLYKLLNALVPLQLDWVLGGRAEKSPDKRHIRGAGENITEEPDPDGISQSVNKT